MRRISVVLVLTLAAPATAGAAKHGLAAYVDGLTTDDPGKRVAAASAVAGLGPNWFPPLIPLHLLPLLGDPRPVGESSPRLAAARALAAEGPLAVDELLDALRWPDYEVRARAAWTLAVVAPPQAFAGLVAALKDDTSDVRAESVTALAALKDKRAVDPILAVLADARRTAVGPRPAPPSRSVTSATRAAPSGRSIVAMENGGGCRGLRGSVLHKLTGVQSFGHDPYKWRGWYEQEKK